MDAQAEQARALVSRDARHVPRAAEAVVLEAVALLTVHLFVFEVVVVVPTGQREARKASNQASKYDGRASVHATLETRSRPDVTGKNKTNELSNKLLALCCIYRREDGKQDVGTVRFIWHAGRALSGRHAAHRSNKHR